MSRFISNDEDSISQYFKDVRREKLLTPEQEVDLAKQIDDGSQIAIDKMRGEDDERVSRLEQISDAMEENWARFVGLVDGSLVNHQVTLGSLHRL